MGYDEIFKFHTSAKRMQLKGNNMYISCRDLIVVKLQKIIQFGKLSSRPVSHFCTLVVHDVVGEKMKLFKLELETTNWIFVLHAKFFPLFFF